MCHRVRTEATNLHPTHHSIIIIIIIITITIRTNSAPGRYRRARRCQSGSEGAGKNIDKYQDLAMELRRLWKVKSKMILIVVWCSRNSTRTKQCSLSVELLQKTALFGTAMRHGTKLDTTKHRQPSVKS